MFYRAALGLIADGDPWVKECAAALLASQVPDTPWWRDYWTGQLHGGNRPAFVAAAHWLAWRHHLEALDPYRPQLLAEDCLDLPLQISANRISPARDHWRQDLLTHPNPAVRLQALMVFRKELNEEDLAAESEWLREVLAQPVFAGYAGHVLGWLSVPGLVGDLVKAVDAAPNLEAKRNLLNALRASPDPEARAALLALALRPEPDLRSLLPKVIFDIGGAWGAAALGQLLDQPWPPPCTGASLGRMGTEGSLAVLLAHEGASPAARAQVADGLGRHPDPGAWPVLMRLLCDSEHRVRRAAVLALANTLQNESMDLLVTLAGNADARMRQAAVWALCRRPGASVLAVVRLIRRLHPEPWPPVPFPEILEREPRSEARSAAEFLVHYVHSNEALPWPGNAWSPVAHPSGQGKGHPA